MNIKGIEEASNPLSSSSSKGKEERRVTSVSHEEFLHGSEGDLALDLSSQSAL